MSRESTPKKKGAAPASSTPPPSTPITQTSSLSTATASPAVSSQSAPAPSGTPLRPTITRSYSSPQMSKLLTEKKAIGDDEEEGEEEGDEYEEGGTGVKKSRDLKSDFSDSESYSAAVALPLDDKELKKISKSPADFLNYCKDYIVEHASRRIDLFFYKLIAYFGVNKSPKQGNVDHQHGKGRNLGRRKKRLRQKTTQGCHSSLFGMVTDETAEEEAKFTLINRDNDICRKGILTGTHFMDNLNATIELPVFVNHLDGRLETLRPEAMEVIEEVAKSKIDPIQGLLKFLTLLQGKFRDLENTEGEYLTDDLLTSPQEIRSELLNLVYEGTFSCALSADGKILNERLELLLRIPQNCDLLLLSAAGSEAEARHIIEGKKSEKNTYVVIGDNLFYFDQINGSWNSIPIDKGKISTLLNEICLSPIENEVKGERRIHHRLVQWQLEVITRVTGHSEQQRYPHRYSTESRRRLYLSKVLKLQREILENKSRFVVTKEFKQTEDKKVEPKSYFKSWEDRNEDINNDEDFVKRFMDAMQPDIPDFIREPIAEIKAHTKQQCVVTHSSFVSIPIAATQTTPLTQPAIATSPAIDSPATSLQSAPSAAAIARSQLVAFNSDGCCESSFLQPTSGELPVSTSIDRKGEMSLPEPFLAVDASGGSIIGPAARPILPSPRASNVHNIFGRSGRFKEVMDPEVIELSMEFTKLL